MTPFCVIVTPLTRSSRKRRSRTEHPGVRRGWTPPRATGDSPPACLMRNVAGPTRRGIGGRITEQGLPDGCGRLRSRPHAALCRLDDGPRRWWDVRPRRYRRRSGRRLLLSVLDRERGVGGPLLHRSVIDGHVLGTEQTEDKGRAGRPNSSTAVRDHLSGWAESTPAKQRQARPREGNGAYLVDQLVERDVA